MNSADDVRDKMQKLCDFILDAEMTVRGGKMVDMSTLDRDVTILCNKAIALPPAQAMDVQPLMAELIGNLERLTTALKDYKASYKK